MQISKLRAAVKLAAVDKNFVRCTATATRENEDINKNIKPWNKIPGPPSLPLVGPMFSFFPGGKVGDCKGVKLFEKLYKVYGPVVRLEGIFGGPDMVMLFDADAIEHVLRSENTMPIRPGFPSLEYYRKRHNKTYDPKRQTGLISDHGENWKDFRSKVNHIMLQPRTIKLYKDVLEDVASDMVEKLRTVRDENNMITKKMDLEMNLWALESIGVVALGTRLNCFDPNIPTDSPERKLIQNVNDFFTVSEKLDFGPSIWRVFSTPMFKKAMKVYEEQESLTKFFIDKAIKNMEMAKNTTADTANSERPILEKLLEIDVGVAYIMASDMLMAGVDTAANTALATLYLLATNPDKQNKLREEILAKQTRQPFLRACIKESMRMLPVVTGNLRKATKEFNLLGYQVPKDVYVIFPHQYMSNMEEHYPNPDKFIPERWLSDKEDPLYHGKTHPFVMSPFGYGVRMCIGRRIAELEMETLISKVIENFVIDWTGGPIKISPTSINYISGPYYFVFKDL